jgi:two-component system, chemotaxis family, CheB/CheR fusion protein
MDDPNLINGKAQNPFSAIKSKPLPIIAIGASAGGLDALRGFFYNMPPDINLSFVVIQHLDPQHKSIMKDLLEKYTKMVVFEAKDGMVVEPNCIYLNPPNTNMAILDGTLQLIQLPKTHPLNLPINYFFRSLASDQAEYAIGIVLSGTGSDGTLGVKAITDAGGMVMVQEEKQAQYDGMPRNAINTGLVDYILTVEKMPVELVKYVQHPYSNSPEKTGVAKQSGQNYFKKIFILIRSQTGHDFSNYKQNTIRRRIERRMVVHQIKNIADYVQYISQTPSEVESLFKDLLITVTNFFRDPESFDILKESIIPDLIAKVSDGSSIRCWVTGCATGEEAYSIAIIFAEVLSQHNRYNNVQIFATDIDNDAIETARMGIYPDSIVANVSPERIQRFFNKDSNMYQIKKQIREMVVFASQNLIKDPPFSRLHLISCRNLLIYMDQVLQKQILPLFHYSLNQDGILFLGSSESIGEFTNLFEPVETKWKIFKRIGLDRDLKSNYPNIPIHSPVIPYKENEPVKIIQRGNIKEIAQNIVMEEYSPIFVIINGNLDILYFNGDTSKYLSPPIGESSFNILRMTSKDIHFKISTAIHKAFKQKTQIICKNLQFKYDSRNLTIDIIIRPISDTKNVQELMMILFRDKVIINRHGKKKKKIVDNTESNQEISILKQELESTKEYLQTTIEELETSNEELKSSNEEIQSTNEELQSTNEELETSKEELQSTNEEISTVNSELKNKVDELFQANNDINNLLESTQIGTIFLDMDLKIKRFTPAITKMFNLIKSDINRPISDITANFVYDNLLEDAKNILKTLNNKDVELHNKNNEWYSMRMTPYRTTQNVIDGIVITFIDVTGIKKIEESKQESELKYQLLLEKYKDLEKGFKKK